MLHVVHGMYVVARTMHGVCCMLYLACCMLSQRRGRSIVCFMMRLVGCEVRVAWAAWRVGGANEEGGAEASASQEVRPCNRRQHATEYRNGADASAALEVSFS